MLPSEVDIMGQPYTVSVDRKLEDHGECHFDEKHIVIREPDDERTLLHESTHAILKQTGLCELITEQEQEAIVVAVENGLWQAGYRRKED